jgi:hypothetical protein
MEAGISFKAWVAEKIQFVGYFEATRLARIGGSKDPSKALEDFRAKGKARKATHDGKVALRNATDPSPTTRPPTGNAAVHQYLKDALGPRTNPAGAWLA